MCLPKAKSKAVLAALSISLICFGHAANAAIILLGGSNSIDAFASVDTQSGSLADSASETSSDNISDFDDLVEANVSLSDGSASGMAQQTSQIRATSILASGEAKVSAELTVSDPEFTSVAEGRRYDRDSPKKEGSLIIHEPINRDGPLGRFLFCCTCASRLVSGPLQPSS